jgi:hypothetical protein
VYRAAGQLLAHQLAPAGPIEREQERPLALHLLGPQHRFALAVEAHRTPGTLVLALVFLACFAVYYFANWKWLADVWQVR